MTVYFISGLGADKRAFQKLVLPQSWNIQHIEWIENLADEPLADYCKRLSSQIDSTTAFSLVGLSFGGIVAVELSKILSPQNIIIVSSVATKKELPMDAFGNFLMRKLKVYKLIPSSIFRSANAIAFWFFGTKTNDEKKLLTQIIEDTLPKFAKWALGNILTWNNITKPANLFHIHGTADKLFPIKKTNADVKIADGGHFMVYSKADIISKILVERLSDRRQNIDDEG